MKRSAGQLRHITWDTFASILEDRISLRTTTRRSPCSSGLPSQATIRLNLRLVSRCTTDGERRWTGTTPGPESKRPLLRAWSERGSFSRRIIDNCGVGLSPATIPPNSGSIVSWAPIAAKDRNMGSQQALKARGKSGARPIGPIVARRSAKSHEVQPRAAARASRWRSQRGWRQMLPRNSSTVCAAR